MIKIFVNDTNVSAYLADESLTVIDQIGNKANTSSFQLNKGATAPEENQEVKIFDVVDIVSYSGTALVVKDKLRSGLSLLTFSKFRVGEYIWLGIGAATEERVTISAVAAGAAGQVNITLSAAAVSAHIAGEFAGKLVFGGTLTYVKQENPHQLTDVEYDCQATDYTKIFDKKNVNDSWEDVDARYIINDFLNTTINYNAEVDDMDYANNTAIQAEWIESGDGTNPTVDTSDLIQGTSAGTFPWTNSGGSATFSATPTSQNLSDLTGAASGTPTKGNLTLWYKRSIATGITSLTARIGSSSSDYRALTIPLEADTDWHFISVPLTGGSSTGTPVWTAADYLAFIVAETVSGNFKIDDVRMTADGSFTAYNLEASNDFDDVRFGFKKPTICMDRFSKGLGFFWYIDYEKDIHFFPTETTGAPFNIADASDNFNKLVVDVDTAQLKNRQVVRGGEKTSDSTYTQVIQGDNAIREWIMKAKFKNLTIKLDNNTSKDTTEAGTTTTTINATTHGLVVGDWIVNRTRSAARKVLTVPTADQFTVEAVASQTDGDTFSKFAAAQTVGIENLVDETTVNYVSNFNEKSIRAGSATATLPTTSYLLFEYNEIIPIRVQVTDYVSVAALKALIGGDGIFDGAVIMDTSIKSTQDARDRGQAEVTEFGNPIVKISFTTDHEGLKAGQTIQVTDTNKGIAGSFIIQKVKMKWRAGDAPDFDIQCASTLFGIIEYFQKLSRAISERDIDEDEVIDQILGESATITISDVNTFVPTEQASEAATITVTPSETATDRSMTTDQYVWQPDASDTRWNLFSWG